MYKYMYMRKPAFSSGTIKGMCGQHVGGKRLFLFLIFSQCDLFQTPFKTLLYTGGQYSSPGISDLWYIYHFTDAGFRWI